MNEKTGEAEASAPILIAAEALNRSAGELLRQARESQGLRLDAVAAALKVPAQKIEALENDALDLLPDAVFARALAASMCRALRVDPTPILAKLPGALRTELAATDKTINARFRGGSERTGRGGWRLSRGLLAVIVLLLVGAVALYAVPQSWLDAISVSVHKALKARPEASKPVASVAAVPAPSEGASSASVDSAGESVEPEAPVTPPLTSASRPLTAGTQLLAFTARAESWIRVTDSKGAFLLNRLVNEGETVRVVGSLPFAVSVGRAASVDVQVRGQPFDLKLLTSAGGVAHFDVKP